MKTILIATDFTEASRNATVYGLNLATAFNARAIIFSAYQQILIPVMDAPVLMMEEQLKELTQQQFNDQIIPLTTKYPIKIDTASKEGPIAFSIIEHAKESGADIIIVGMKMHNKGLKKVFGDTVTEIMKKSKIPVLVVPENAEYTTPSAIVLATETDVPPESDPHVVDSLREIGERFHSRIYLTRIFKNKMEEAFEWINRPHKLIRLMGTLDPEYQVIEAKKDISTAINDFISNNKINMVAMLPRKHSVIERWFIKSKTRSMAFVTTVPLLILPENVKDKDRSSL